MKVSYLSYFDWIFYGIEKVWTKKKLIFIELYILYFVFWLSYFLLEISYDFFLQIYDNDKEKLITTTTLEPSSTTSYVINVTSNVAKWICWFFCN